MQLQIFDLLIVIAYLAGVLVFGIWIGRRQQQSREGFFLGGRQFGWWLIGTSLFAANISSVQFVGQSGLTYQIGIAAANPQLIGGFMLGISAIFFIPVYLRTGIFTIPGFLEQRFDRRCKLIYCLTMVAMGLVTIPVMLYAGCLVVVQIFGVDETYLLPCAIVLGLTVGVYAIVGGLSSVVYTEMIHSLVLILGAALVLVLGLNRVGGLDVLMNSIPTEHFSLIQPMDHAQMPFTGVLTGLAFSSIFWASSNQELLQRTLGARDVRNAQLGMLLGAFLKILAIFILVFPGLIALHLVPGINPDRAYPALVQTLLPVGLSGVVMAGFLAALMSSLDSGLISLSSVFTIEIYPLLDRKVSERKALLVGRIAAGVVLVWGVIAAPWIEHLGLIYPLILKTGAYLFSSVGVCYLVGRFSRRVNATGALVTLTVGLLAGVLLVPLTSVPELQALAPAWLLETNFLHVGAGLVLVYAVCLYGFSALRPAPAASQLAFMTPETAGAGAGGPGGATESVGLLRSFRFWFVIYILCFLGVYLLF
ncbi:SLC5 family protein [Actomonas aquatica]|uniref:Sodium/solute symporter n=1 Tax=Actomonas aquatica TaxID=2866162 RepID=A0ABZ1C4L8_9BACT|nr:sodium/solute symporter [Opitutus sp. WL0086]WRQ86401.1 sodium/solute symporter [Opitutus sp. WL0086]